MTAKPPPELPISYAVLGLDIGILFLVASLAHLGWLAFAYPVAGFTLGKIFGAVFP